MDDGKKGTVLVVDDDPGLLKFASSLLETDYKVQLAPSGQAALRHLRAGSPPDVILLDIDMPEMDGYETIAEIKKLENCRNVPVIFLTALADKAHEMRGLGEGAADYICKPFDAELLLLRIANHMETGKRLRWKGGMSPERRVLIQPLLTGQELKAAELVAQGKSNEEVAAALGVSEKRANNIVHGIHTALGTGRRQELKRYLRGELELSAGGE